MRYPAAAFEKGSPLFCGEPGHDSKSFFSLYDRGRLAPGCKADVNLLDLDKLMLKTPRRVEDLPGGGARFIQDCEGIAATFVAGEMIYREGVATGALPGKLVRGMQAASA